MKLNEEYGKLANENELLRMTIENLPLDPFSNPAHNLDIGPGVMEAVTEEEPENTYMPSSPPNTPYHIPPYHDQTFSKNAKTHCVHVSNFGRRAICEGGQGHVLGQEPFEGDGVKSYKMRVLELTHLKYGLATQLEPANDESDIWSWTIDETGCVRHAGEPNKQASSKIRRGDVIGIVLDRNTGELEFIINGKSISVFVTEELKDLVVYPMMSMADGTTIEFC